ncbi:GNAT family N-acetyltransferase [Mesobacillus zeae]|nr:GNAT family N-acetyltransferase [Mesobacillus zeae]
MNLMKETERLFLRPLQAADYENWLLSFNNRFPSLYRHDRGKMDMSDCTEEWFCQLVDKHKCLAENDEAYIFGAFLKEGGTHVGMIDFSTLARMDFQWARIGYTIHNQFWKKGYGKEAVVGLIEAGFEELNYHRIEAHINLDNEPSKRLALCVGMEFECIRKGFIFENEEWTDHEVYTVNRRY